MTRTMRIVFVTLILNVLAVTAGLSTGLAMVNLHNLLSSGGGTIKQSPVIYPSDYKIQRALSTSTGLSDVTVRWTDNSPEDTSTLVERANSAGVWSTVATFNQPLAGPQTFVDHGLPADTEWCYRVRIRGADSAEVLTSSLCAVTQMLGDPGVFRTQLRIRVANVSSGGTDGLVSVSLNAGPGNVPTGSWTGINTPIDDLEAGSDVTYDLIQNGIGTLRDITRVGIYTNSTDGFCVAQIQLSVNGAVAFDRLYGDTATTCEWVDGYHAILVRHDELRASPLFAGFVSPAMSPRVLPTELVSRLEAIIGTMTFERTDVAWRDPGDGPGVEISHVADDTVRADIHLVSTGFASPDIHLQLDTRVSFQSSGNVWELVFEPVQFHADVDFPWWADVIVAITDPICTPTAAIAGAAFDDCMSLLEQYIAQQIEAGFSAPSQRVKVSLPANCITPAVSVAGDGSLWFSCAQTRTTTTTLTKGAVTTKSLLLR